ncbi:hypothetical protein FQA39_LY06944 [Lamprigera yunnana]|nr:hypothetical protein FQA39_LY06944 [Lamprigera yunnana]
MLKMLNEPDQRKEVVQKALFGDVISKQLKENYFTLKRIKERQIFEKVVTGSVLQKYKHWIPKEMKSLSKSHWLRKESADQKGIKGIINVHQVAGVYSSSIFGFPNKCKTLTMKSLSCFYNSVSCEHYKIGSINFALKPTWTVEVFTASELEDLESAEPKLIPTPNKSPQRLDVDIAGTSGTRNSCYNTGDYVLVKFPTKNVKYRYAAVINEIDDDKNDLRVAFLKICDHNVQTFRIDDKDISDVSFDEIIQKLDNPDLIVKGKRIFYQFSTQVDVFER